MKLTLFSALCLSAVVLFPQDPVPEDERPVPEVGQAAPAIRLNDHAGNATAVGGEAEHWSVLAFYPRAMTPG